MSLSTPLSTDWLWGLEELSDITLLIHPCSTAASPGYFRPHVRRLRAKAAQEAAGKVATDSSAGATSTVQLPTPAAAPPDSSQQSPPTGILGDLCQWFGIEQPSRPPTAVARLNHTVLPHTGLTLHLTLHPGEPNTVPEGVLCHVYTGKLPDDPEQLLWMLWRADYLDLAATVTAIVTKLQSLADSKKMNLQHALLLHSLPPLQTATGSGGSVTGSIMSAVWPAAPHILMRPTLVEQFSQLPLELVSDWVQSPAITYDSANTLAVLFTAWYDAQPTPPTEEQCQQLSAMLPLSSLTLCFHLQVLPLLKWWRGTDQPVQNSTPPRNRTLLHAASLILPRTKKLQAAWSEVAQATSLSLSAATPAPYTCTLTYAVLQRLWDKKRLDLDPVVAWGYQWTPCFKLNEDLSKTENGVTASPPKGKGWRLGWFNELRWPAPLEAHASLPRLGALVKASATLTLTGTDKSQPTVGQCSASWWEPGGWGVLDAMGRSYTEFSEFARSRTTTLKMEMTWENVKA